MSEDGSFGAIFIEKLVGLIILFIGIVTTVYTLTSQDVLKSYVGLFALLSVIMVLLGLFLILAKTE
jgi:hypothetical protein